MNLAQIAWPVFKLGEHKPHQQDGVVFYSKQYQDKDDSTSIQVGLRIVDDKNILGDTLGLRRLKLRESKVKLFYIRSAIYMLKDLIKLSKQTTWWIDSKGTVFQYKKSTRAKLTCKRVKKYIPGEVVGCIVEVEGLSQRFKLMYHPKNGEQWAGVLQWGLSYILYGIYTEPFKNTYRLV